MEKLKILKGLSLFNNLKEEELKNLIKNYTCEKKYSQKSIIFNEGDEINDIGIVLEGSIQLINEDAFGNLTILHQFTGPALFGEAFVCGGVEKIPQKVMAISPCKILFLSYYQLKKASPSYLNIINENLISIISKKNIFLREKLNLLNLPTSRDKLFYYLSQEKKKSPSSYFKIDFSITQLAQYLNLNRSSLSRELSKLKEEGYIDYYRNTFKINPR